MRPDYVHKFFGDKRTVYVLLMLALGLITVTLTAHAQDKKALDSVDKAPYNVTYKATCDSLTAKIAGN